MNTSPDTRASLILRMQSADDSLVWNEFVGLYQTVIYRTARRQGLKHEDATEVTQEVLTRVTRSIDGWEHNPKRGSFRGWLYRITRNLSIDFLRKSKNSPLTGHGTTVFASLSNDGDDDPADFDLQLERELFRQAAARLEGRFASNTWSAFWSTAIQGHPVEEVAKRLSMSRGAVYIARSRVMARLKKEVNILQNETIGQPLTGKSNGSEQAGS